VQAATLARLRETASGHAIVVPRYGGRRGHPVVFSSALFGEILATPDELGARHVVRQDASRVYELDVDDPGVLVDVDTPADLARLRGREAT
jgi:molybdenum cofactor cytidylyltransferase